MLDDNSFLKSGRHTGRLLRWLRDFSIFLVLVLIAYRLAVLEVNPITISYPELLGIVLAFFAVGMSSWFFFKASDVSNRFYADSFKYMKEMSETLGRMEERFGEKFTGIEKHMERMPVMNDGMKAAEIAKKQEEIEAIKAEGEKQKNQAAAQVRAALNEASIATEQQEQILGTLATLQARHHHADSEIARLRYEIEELRRAPDRIDPELLTTILHVLHGFDYRMKTSKERRKAIANVINSLPAPFKEHLRSVGLWSPTDEPTAELENIVLRHSS